MEFLNSISRKTNRISTALGLLDPLMHIELYCVRSRSSPNFELYSGLSMSFLFDTEYFKSFQDSVVTLSRRGKKYK